jgi:hypothetical protein
MSVILKVCLEPGMVHCKTAHTVSARHGTISVTLGSRVFPGTKSPSHSHASFQLRQEGLGNYSIRLVSGLVRELVLASRGWEFYSSILSEAVTRRSAEIVRTSDCGWNLCWGENFGSDFLVQFVMKRLRWSLLFVLFDIGEDFDFWRAKKIFGRCEFRSGVRNAQGGESCAF